jgi:hypothetical protein
MQSHISSHKIKDPPHRNYINMSKIMLGNSRGFNTIIAQKRDRSSYFCKPIVRSGLLPSHLGGADDDVGKVGDATGD